jgi:hypothetical protein
MPSDVARNTSTAFCFDEIGFIPVLYEQLTVSLLRFYGAGHLLILAAMAVDGVGQFPGAADRAGEEDNANSRRPESYDR